MANEYFQRTPTNSGNRSTHTWSGWIKRNVLGDWTRLFSTAGQTLLQLTGSSPPDQIRYLDQTGSNYDLRSTALLRDVGSWMHIVLSVDHTLSVPRDRVRIYVNGVELDDYSTDSSSNGSQNLETFFNTITEHGLLGRETVNTGENFKGEAFDVFWVDGQALTPDVFGFYKDGDGYQSSGTTRATNFRPGQWSPRAPKSIKHTINRSGGFGVNGFYLPMNDSSNFGADFHCAPNSIITLKGEDLPQPRNGAPTTTDAYVSQLRSDPFAANLILACPFVADGFGQDGAVSSTITGLGDYHIALGGPSSIPAVNFLIGSGTQAQVTGDKGLYYGSSLDVTNNSINPRATVGTAFTPDGDYTVEFWAYQNDLTDAGGAHILQYDSDAGQTGWLISSDVGTFRWTLRNSSNQDVSVSTANVVKSGQWNHFAGVYESSKNLMTAYLNGVAVGTTPVASNYLSTQYTNLNRIHIGSNGGNGSRPMLGYMSDLRIYKGVAKYTGGFDVPKPYTPVGIESWRTTADTCKNNFCTWNSLTNHHTNPHTLTNGNLRINNSNHWRTILGTHGVSSGKWYYEMKTFNDADYLYLGWGNSNTNVANYPSEDNNAWTMRIDEPKAYHDQTGDNTQVPLSPAFTQNDICGVAFDADNGRIWWSRNGVWLTSDGNNNGDPAAGTGAIYDSEIPTGVTYHPIAGVYTETAITNFGQNPSFSGAVTAGTNADDSGKGLFKYAPPSGFLALCTDNLPDPVIADPGKYFKSVFYTGDGIAGHSITGVGFKPDFVWLKGRTGSSFNHILCDSVRGSKSTLFSNNALQEYTDRGVRSFDDDGFTLSVASGDENNSGIPYVAWCWKAGGPAVTNNEGNITTQVSANPTAGFSIVKSNGPGTSGHGLNSTPKFIIQKSLTAGNWNVAHCELYAPGSTGKILLNFTDPVVASSTTYMHNATATTFDPMFSAEQIAYVWAEIEGFSKFGYYLGNSNTDGPFVYCGFKPAWVLVKNIDSSGSHWVLWDSSRTPYNEMQNALRPNSIDPETSGFQFDFLSNGFKVRDGELSVSEADDKFIFAAFAESPFQTANAK